ncbi:hypothetical protein ACLMJK_003396 [Lecanora helva]
MTVVNGSTDVSIIDIRHGSLTTSLVDEIRAKLNPSDGGEKTMPTLLLYDEQGLKLFEDITYLDEYYLTNAEIEALKSHASEIVDRVPAGTMVIELGSGNLRKVNILLQAFEQAGKIIDYYALDLSQPELERTLDAITGSYKFVHCRGLLGTYEDGLAWLKEPENLKKPKCILWLGSSIGNFTRTEAADFLKSFSHVLTSNDLMLIGVDTCQDQNKVYSAYNDKEGKTHEFILNGLKHANRLIGKEVFRSTDWKVIGEYDVKAGRHQVFLSPTVDVKVEQVLVEAGERVRIEESYKYSLPQSTELWYSAGLEPLDRFGDRIGQYHLHLLAKQPPNFPLKASDYAARPVPSISEFEQLWTAWDFVTRHMIPEDELLSKPIKLRNCCLFYLGHIPAFLDIHLTRATGGPPTDPACYHQMFERGIDPDVENPEKCHAHSEIPDEWPPVQNILDYQESVRARARLLCQNGLNKSNRKIGRALWLAFEHEAMHMETLLYMLLQSDHILPPRLTPDFESLGEQARKDAVPNEWIKVPAITFYEGMDDPDNDEGPDRYFGWDNEKPRRQINVPAFEAQARPLTNEDYARFLEHTGRERLPASWVIQEDNSSIPNRVTLRDGNSIYADGGGPCLTDACLHGKCVRTVYGPIPLKDALHWPVFASYDELSQCATWMNGRIPTAEEARSIYHYVDVNKNKHTDSILTKKVSAVNG